MTVKTQIAKEVVELALWTSDGAGHEGDPLLQQLRRALGGNVGRGSAGASSGAPIPLDTGAAMLWEAIAEEISVQFIAATELRPNPHPIGNVLAWLAAYTAADTTTEQDDVALRRVQGWSRRIRDYFAPPRTRELMVPCPNCGYERITLGEDVMAEESFALVATTHDGEVTVTCRNPLCRDVFGERSEWTGEHQLEELGRRVGLTLDSDTLRAALAPVDEPEWAPEGGKTVEPFNPSKPEHAVLVAAAGSAAPAAERHPEAPQESWAEMSARVEGSISSRPEGDPTS